MATTVLLLLFLVVLIRTQGVTAAGAPDFTLPVVGPNGLTGQSVTLSSFRGKVVFLEFMEPWCPHCQHMAPILEDLYTQYQNNANVVFISVAGPWNGPDGNPASAQDAANFMKGGPVDGESNTWGPSSWTYVYDSSGTVMHTLYGVNSTPTFFIIGNDGSIITTFSGEQTYEALAASLTLALSGSQITVVSSTTQPELTIGYDWPVAGSLSVSFRNVGSVSIDMGRSDFFINGAPVVMSGCSGLTLMPGQSCVVTLSYSGVTIVVGAAYPLRIVTPDGAVFSYAVIYGNASTPIQTNSNSIDDFVGEWTNTDPNTRGITRIDITRSGDSLMLHAWGSCEPTDCDWGVISVPYSGQPFIPQYVFSFAVDTLTMTLENGTLHVHDFTHFTDNSGRQDYGADYYFTRAIGPASTVNTETVAYQTQNTANQEISSPDFFVNNAFGMIGALAGGILLIGALFGLSAISIATRNRGKGLYREDPRRTGDSRRNVPLLIIIVLGAFSLVTVSVLTPRLTFNFDLLASRVPILLAGALVLIMITSILGFTWIVVAILRGRRKSLRNLEPNESEMAVFPQKEPQTDEIIVEPVKMKKCHYCGTEVPRDNRLCRKCGMPAIYLGADPWQ